MPRLGGASDFWARKLGGTTSVQRQNPEDAKLNRKQAKTFSNGDYRPRVVQQHVKDRRHVVRKPPAVRLLNNSMPIPNVIAVGQVSYRIDDTQQSHPEIVDKTVCNQMVAERMALLVASGVTQRVAAAAMGIRIYSMQQWNAWGERDLAAGIDSVFANFWSAMLMAKASCEANWVARLNEGSATDWKAAAYMLERRFGVRWAPKAPKEKLLENGDVSNKSIEELQEMLKLLMAGSLALPAPAEPGNGEPDSDTTKA